MRVYAVVNKDMFREKDEDGSKSIDFGIQVIPSFRVDYSYNDFKADKFLKRDEKWWNIVFGFSWLVFSLDIVVSSRPRKSFILVEKKV